MEIEEKDNPIITASMNTNNTEDDDINIESITVSVNSNIPVVDDVATAVEDIVGVKSDDVVPVVEDVGVGSDDVVDDVAPGDEVVDVRSDDVAKVNVDGEDKEVVVEDEDVDDVAKVAEDINDVAEVNVAGGDGEKEVVEDVDDVAKVVEERNDVAGLEVPSSDNVDVEKDGEEDNKVVPVNNEFKDVENIDNVNEEDEAMIEEKVVEEVVEEDEEIDELKKNVELEENDNSQETVGLDVKNNVGDVKVEDIDNVKEDETMVEDKVDDEVVKKDEEEEPLMETEERGDDDVMVNDEEKSLDTEMEETEKTLDVETENEKTEMETEEEEIVAGEEKGEETETEPEAEQPESSKKGSSVGKRKRGKAAPKSPATPKKMVEEDVCFICFDGGDLVLCDRRNCPKAYHPSCVNRDEAFFQTKGRWNCGWHMCSICEKKADYMCYTCTYSLCKACTKTNVILCVREKEKKGLCEACMKTVMQIENQETEGNVNFDDKNSWEHLFKDYWTETKEKHNLSLAELSQAKNPWKGSGKQESSIAQSDVKDDDIDPKDPPETPKPRKSRRNAKKQKSAVNEDDSSTGAGGSTGPSNADWLSKELLELVTHMRNGDSSVISQYEIQDLLLEYIKKYNLRDPSRMSQIICDARLKKIFGKPRVAHIEMLKLLESHYLVKEDSQIDDVQGTVVDTEASPADDKDKKRKGRKKGDRRGPQSNREDYAAIDNHNINMIYLRRKLVEDLLDDMETFHEKIVGTFVRIRISGANQKQDIYRLVQVTGTSEGARYTLSKKTTCTMLEILNLDKNETISIDSISNQEFTEDECKRLRQSIKCGLISRLTVGEVLDKAMELQMVRVNDWLETEVVRLNHLRDRASDMGRKKELRECVEKLNLLKTPEERARRLEEFPVIHDDPTMDPDYGSEDDTDMDDKKQELNTRPDSFNRFNNRGKDQFSPRGDYTSKESWSGGTPKSSNSSKNYEFTRNLSNKSFSPKPEDHSSISNFQVHTENSSRDQRRDPFLQQPVILEKPTVPSLRETPVAPDSTAKVDETEKMWHYKDPSEKIQGPFSMVQLRKWSKNGYFPVGLKIWRKSDKEDDAILLSDALEGKFRVVNTRTVSQDRQKITADHTHGTQIAHTNSTPNSRRDYASFPSPTPDKGTTGWTEGQAGQHTGPSGNEGLQSPTPNSSHMAGPTVPSLVPCGTKDTNSVGPTVPLAVAPQNIEQAIQNIVQSSQVAPPDNSMTPQMMQSVSGQNPQGWSGAPQQILQPNPAMNMANLQQLAYNQWGGVPNMVQNTNLVGNMMPQEQWAQFPFPVTQPIMQQQQQPPTQPTQANVNWGSMIPDPNMGWVAPNPGTPMNWGPMVQGQQVTGTVDPTWAMQAANVQAGWVPQPPVPGVVPNQSWVGTTPLQVPGSIVAGNVNPGSSWVAPPGTQVASNAGWVGAPTVNQGPAGPANVNTGSWVGPPGTQGGPVANQGWVPPTGNQGTPPPSGNNNQNWGSPSPRNRGNWGGNDNRGNFSGQRRYNNNNNNNSSYNRGSGGYRGGGGNRRNFNKQDSFHKDGGSHHNDGGSFHGGSGDQPARSSDQ